MKREELGKIFAAIKIMDFDLFLNMYPKVGFYPKNSRKAFSVKLNAIFDELKSKGDTFLKIKDCTCHFECGTCKPDPSKYYIAFVGNVSNDYFGFTTYMNNSFEPYFINLSGIFEFSIYNKNSNNYNETIEGQKFGDQQCFVILEDEQDNFVPSDEYLDAILLKDKAFKDFEQHNNMIEDLDILKKWLTNYKCSIFDNRRRFVLLREFESLYSSMSTFDSYAHNNSKAKCALDEFKYDNRYNPGNRFEWLMKYEDFYEKNFHVIKYDKNNGETDYFFFGEESKYKIAKSIFKDSIDFINVYKDNYEEEKYYWQELCLEMKNTTLDNLYSDNNFQSKLSVFYNLLAED